MKNYTITKVSRGRIRVFSKCVLLNKPKCQNCIYHEVTCPMQCTKVIAAVNQVHFAANLIWIGIKDRTV